MPAAAKKAAPEPAKKAAAKKEADFPKEAESYGNEIADFADTSLQRLAELRDRYDEVAAANQGESGHDGTAFELRRLPATLDDVDRVLNLLMGLGNGVANTAAMIG